MYRFGLLLPTESRWEYACRAGTRDLWSTGGDPASLKGLANLRPEVDVDSFEGTAPVGTFPPNAWGLHDVHGNVAEWCRDFVDRYPGNPRPGDGFRTPVATGTVFRCLRGGGWRASALDAAAP
jgi:formylglycine-generating enzyme required for sulfatase activity